MLKVHDKKPWEMTFVDTADLWSFGAWQESFASLDLLACVLGLESPKESGMSGDKVGEAYWKRGDIAGIKHYCQNDVLAVMNVILDWSSLPQVSFENAVRA